MRRILFALLLLVSFAGFSQNARADNLAVNFLIDGMPGDPTVPSALYKASHGAAPFPWTG